VYDLIENSHHSQANNGRFPKYPYSTKIVALIVMDAFAASKPNLTLKEEFFQLHILIRHNMKIIMSWKIEISLYLFSCSATKFIIRTLTKLQVEKVTKKNGENHEPQNPLIAP